MKIEFMMQKIASRKYKITYNVFCKEEDINLTNVEFFYSPHVDFTNEADARRGGIKCLHNVADRVYKYRGRKQITCVSIDMGVPKVLKNEPAQAADVPSERVYEVIQKDGIWTINKRSTPFLTEEQAKIELMKHITNKD